VKGFGDGRHLNHFPKARDLPLLHFAQDVAFGRLYLHNLKCEGSQGFWGAREHAKGRKVIFLRSI